MYTLIMEGEIFHATDSKPAYSSKELASMEEEAIITAGKQIPQLQEADPGQVRAIVKNALGMMAQFETIARSRKIGHHQPVHLETDIVWVLPGPGMYDKRRDPEIQDRYIHLPWTRRLNWTRIITGAALVRQTTAARTGKPVSEITLEDIKEHGPYFVYPSTPLEAKHLEHVLERPTTKIPREKVFIYTDVKVPDGTSRDIVNTADQLEGLRFPDNIIPREIMLVTTSTHMVRTLHMLGKFSNLIPDSTNLRAWPTRTPPDGRMVYPVMETRGILAGIYKDHTASPTPHSYTL